MNERWMDQVEPQFSGTAGKAWKIALPEPSGDWRDELALDANYLIFAPQAHPFWLWHVLLGVSLRDAEGQDAPPIKSFPSATHELMVWALDPNKPVPDPREWIMRHEGLLLQPPDVVEQFEVTSDEQATEILTLCAKACTAGVLVPDSDWLSAWHDSLEKTSEHYREGRRDD